MTALPRHLLLISAQDQPPTTSLAANSHTRGSVGSEIATPCLQKPPNFHAKQFGSPEPFSFAFGWCLRLGQCPGGHSVDRRVLARGVSKLGSDSSMARYSRDTLQSGTWRNFYKFHFKIPPFLLGPSWAMPVSKAGGSLTFPSQKPWDLYCHWL